MPTKWMITKHCLVISNIAVVIVFFFILYKAVFVINNTETLTIHTQPAITLLGMSDCDNHEPNESNNLLTNPTQHNRHNTQPTINFAKYELSDFTYIWRELDGSAYYFPSIAKSATNNDSINPPIDTGNHNVNTPSDKYSDIHPSFVYCPIAKSGCTIWKQLFRRMKGLDYLNTEFNIVHGSKNKLQSNRLYKLETRQADEILGDPDVIHATFVRDPLERALSAFLDKCHKSQWKASWCVPFTVIANNSDSDRDSDSGSVVKKQKSLFDLFINRIIFADPSKSAKWHIEDYHSVPQNWFCDLWKYHTRYKIYRSENKTHTKMFLESLNLWDKLGSYGWTKNNNGSLLDYSVYHSVNAKTKIFKYFTPYMAGKLISWYKSDYILFNIEIPNFVCDFFDNKYYNTNQYTQNNFDFNQLKENWNNITNKWYYDESIIRNIKNVLFNLGSTVLLHKNKFPTMFEMVQKKKIDDDNHNDHNKDIDMYTIELTLLREKYFLYNIISFMPFNTWPNCLKDEKERIQVKMKLDQQRMGLVDKIKQLPKKIGRFAPVSDGNKLQRSWLLHDSTIFRSIVGNAEFMRDAHRRSRFDARYIKNQTQRIWEMDQF